MDKTVVPPPSWRAAALRRIEATNVAGFDTHHSRAMNLEAIRGLLHGDPAYTLGITSVERVEFKDALDAVASVTGYSSDPEVTTGGGYIAPTATLRGLEEAACRIAEVAERHGRFLVATGHPGSLLLFCTELARLIRSWGGEIAEPARGVWVPPNLTLDYVAGVAVTTDGRSLQHTHDHRAMELMLEDAEHIDLVIGDHGYAGAAINAGLPVVTLVDTNDPVPAVARRLGADVTIIPADDNLPPSSYLPLTELMRELVDRSWIEVGLPEYSVGWCDRRQDAPGRPVA
ncbi:MAG: phosphatase [Chloroflexi bacterium]|nr:phosphatase [Chloroflexota bacterium]